MTDPLALNTAHDDWVDAHLDVPFAPGDYPAAGDYNQHYPDLEADGEAEDEFAAAAARATLKVEAVRDDGAILVTSGAAAVVVSDDGDWVTGRDSALSRGNWTASTGDPFPDLDTATLDRLAEYRTELEAA